MTEVYEMCIACGVWLVPGDLFYVLFLLVFFQQLDSVFGCGGALIHDLVLLFSTIL